MPTSSRDDNEADDDDDYNANVKEVASATGEVEELEGADNAGKDTAGSDGKLVEDDDDDDDNNNDSDNDNEAAKVEEEIVLDADEDKGLEGANDASEDSAVSAGDKADADADADEAGAEESAAPKSNEGFQGTDG